MQWDLVVTEDALLSSNDDRQAALDRRIEGDLVELSWRTNRVATIVGPFAAAAFLAGVVSDLEPVQLWVWFAVLNAVFVMRAAVLVAWSRVKPVGEARLRWRRYFYFGTLLVPLMWGLSGPLFLHQLGPLLQAFQLAIVIGLAGGLIGTISSHKPSILTSLPVMLLPIAGSFIAIGGSIYLILAVLVIVYCLYIMNVGLEHHRTIRDSLRLRFERSELIEQLRTARDEAERANEAKSLFLANMSHELRTPLNAIMGFSEMIELGILGKEKGARQIEYARLIHGSGAHLLDLINDLLDVSKAEAGQLDLHEEKLDLGELVESCLQLLAPAADKAKVRLKGPAKKKTLILNADDRKLRQILINLLSNAMKFTPEGGSVSVVYAVGPEGGVTLSVTDSGIGMTLEQLEKAMHPFVQIEQGYDSKVQGTGLGLPLSKTLAELHGGRLEMQSAPGKGTTAIVHLPAERLVKTKLLRNSAAA